MHSRDMRGRRMSRRNRSRHRCNRRYSANVTSKMADFLGCNPVTPIPEREWGKGKFWGCFELARRRVILIYTYIYCILARYLLTLVSPSSNPFSPTPSPESGLHGYNPQKCWVFGVTPELPKRNNGWLAGYKPAFRGLAARARLGEVEMLKSNRA
jgi:hypothetical protein